MCVTYGRVGIRGPATEVANADARAVMRGSYSEGDYQEHQALMGNSIFSSTKVSPAPQASLEIDEGGRLDLYNSLGTFLDPPPMHDVLTLLSLVA